MNHPTATSPMIGNLPAILRRNTPTARQADSTYAMDVDEYYEDDGDDEDDEEYEDKEYFSYNEQEGRKLKIETPIKTTESVSLQIRPHAAVEKKYRQAVNTKLQQLHGSIPASGKFSVDPIERQENGMKGSETEQAAKPLVLDKAIQYATHLLETYKKYDNDIEDLRQKVREWLDEDDNARLLPAERPLKTCRPEPVSTAAPDQQIAATL